MPKNYGFLKFIVIFMGILIVLGLAVVVWKVIDLAKQKAAREKREAMEQQNSPVVRIPKGQQQPFEFEIQLESGEEILEMTSAPNGLWIRIGKQSETHRMLLLDYSGKPIGQITVTQGQKNGALPAQ